MQFVRGATLQVRLYDAEMWYHLASGRKEEQMRWQGKQGGEDEGCVCEEDANARTGHASTRVQKKYAEEERAMGCGRTLISGFVDDSICGDLSTYPSIYLVYSI